MDKYLIRGKVNSPPDPRKPVRRRNRWKRGLIELDGRFKHTYRHDMAALLMQSYSEVGDFPHLYHFDGVPCPSHPRQISEPLHTEQALFRKQGISCIDFDNKGYYLASVTRSGCLTVHDFETLYCQPSHGLKDMAAQNVLHVSLPKRLDVVRWNIANQDEVACCSRNGNVYVFDIGYISREPVEVLRARQLMNINGLPIVQGFSDIAFASSDASRLYASNTFGAICIWDRRLGLLPCLELQSDSQESLNSVKLCTDNQMLT